MSILRKPKPTTLARCPLTVICKNYLISWEGNRNKLMWWICRVSRWNLLKSGLITFSFTRVGHLNGGKSEYFLKRLASAKGYHRGSKHLMAWLYIHCALLLKVTLQSEGVPIRTIQELMGHKSISMTMRCAHLAENVKQEAIKLLNGLTAKKGCHKTVTREQSINTIDTQLTETTPIF